MNNGELQGSSHLVDANCRFLVHAVRFLEHLLAAVETRLLPARERLQQGVDERTCCSRCRASSGAFWPSANRCTMSGFASRPRAIETTSQWPAGNASRIRLAVCQPPTQITGRPEAALIFAASSWFIPSIFSGSSFPRRLKGIRLPQFHSLKAAKQRELHQKEMWLVRAVPS